MRPETKYARSGDVSIAYQTLGTGPVDLVLVPGWVSNVEYQWEQPDFAHFLERLASFSRLIVFDKRGTGLSDRVRGVPTLEERMDDVRAVMDAVDSQRAIVFGVSEGGPMTILFAATYPDRTIAAILYGTAPRSAWAPDFPWGSTPEAFGKAVADTEAHWGERAHTDRMLTWLAPSRTGDLAFKDWLTRYARFGASPAAAVALQRMNREIDVRHVLTAISVPTLVLNRVGDDPEPARFTSKQIPGARYIELPGADHLPYTEDTESVLKAIEEFVTGGLQSTESNRVLATVLFTDIVGSTERAASLGDEAWTKLLERHHAVVSRQLAVFRGRELDTAGDGVFASFDGPARAIRCACAIADSLRELGIDVRAGLHTGECEIVGEKLGGIAVHIGARVAGQAAPGEILVSGTVRDLVAGSGLRFRDRGAAQLKGIDGDWRLYAVERNGSTSQ
ncbi:MAG: adenylate/guanylate cyclase domain-containing protein [Candidatus Dormibacteraceae bacterium]